MIRLIGILNLIIPLWVIHAQSLSELSLDRIYGTGEFRSQVMGPLRWFDEGEAYIKFSYNNPSFFLHFSNAAYVSAVSPD